MFINYLLKKKYFYEKKKGNYFIEFEFKSKNCEEHINFNNTLYASCKYK